MKKLILLAAIVTIPTMAMAESQPAVSKRGTCHVFKTQEMVPSDWTLVDNCESNKIETQEVKTGQSLDAVNARRYGNYNWNKRYSEDKEETAAEKNPLRMGSGTLTRGGMDREVAGIIEKQETRVTTSRSLGTTKSYLLEDSRRLTTTKEEWLRRRSARAGISSGSATKMERSGSLSTTSWSSEADKRNSRLDTQSISSKLKQALERRQYLSKRGRVEEKEYEYTGPTLRRLYRGKRMEGDLNN